jgi:hypothetical protein
VGLKAGHLDNTIKILGYCEKSQEIIKHHLQIESLHSLLNMNGEFTLIYTQAEKVIIITSLIGAMQYFYYYDGTTFAHGETILDIVNKLDLQWEWDWESLGDLCEQENLTQNNTMHSQIKKVPAGSILTFKDKLKIRTTNILDQIKIADSNPIDAISLFNQETYKWAGNNPILSLSGGFDSRVILSSMLKQGIYPTVITVGKEDDSDMKVAQMIVDKFMLDHIKVKLSLDDLINNAEHIATITNGSKPSCHWHTYLYPKKAEITKSQSFFVGTLGEFARSYYFDKGFLSLLNESFPKLAQEKFWVLKLSRHRTFLENERQYLCEELGKEVSREGVKKRAIRNAFLSKGEFLSGGSRYYLEQRIPHFYANGISMYNDTSSWRSPFHNIKWLETIWNLSDQWKLGSNWHRLTIKRNYPELLSFPEEKGLSKNRMLSKAPPLYWLPTMQRLKYKSYDMSAEWYADNRIKEIILDNSSFLDELIERRLCEAILKQHLSSRSRTRAISFLLTILYFKLALSRKGK